jgi:hypothetical protein
MPLSDVSDGCIVGFERAFCVVESQAENLNTNFTASRAVDCLSSIYSLKDDLAALKLKLDPDTYDLWHGKVNKLLIRVFITAKSDKAQGFRIMLENQWVR